MVLGCRDLLATIGLVLAWRRRGVGEAPIKCSRPAQENDRIWFLLY